MSPRPDESQCTCPHGERPLGRLYGVNMGRGTVRLSTTKDCPVHDACHGYTKAVRAAQPSWSNPYCPIHATRNCPEPPSGTLKIPEGWERCRATTRAGRQCRRLIQVGWEFCGVHRHLRTHRPDLDAR